MLVMDELTRRRLRRNEVGDDARMLRAQESPDFLRSLFELTTFV